MATKGRQEPYPEALLVTMLLQQHPGRLLTFACYHGGLLVLFVEKRFNVTAPANEEF